MPISMDIILRVAVVASVCVADSERPSINANEAGITLNVPAGSNAYVEIGGTPATRLLSDNDVAAIVAQAVNSAVSQFSAQLDKTTSSLDALTLDNSNLRKDTTASIEALTRENDILRQNITKLGEFKLCDPPASPTNGSRTVPTLFAPGSSAMFSCDDGFTLVGSAQSVCLGNGTLGTAVPTCDKLHDLGSEQRPADSCKDIYIDQLSQGDTEIQSGPRWILVTGKAAQVFCDMNTTSSDGLSGWTLCGKLDSNRPGPQFLSDGFGRRAIGINDMASLDQFTVGGRKWASSDCRSLLPKSRYMMHVGSDEAVLPFGGDNSAVRFTNVLADAKVLPQNFFDTLQEHLGVCKVQSQGAVRTFNQSFEELQADGLNGNIQGLGNGACMLGQGHHFCSFDRKGSRFSNAGSPNPTSGCGGSEGDTVYWAWDDDDHGCNTFLRIGTGCLKTHTQNELGTPTFRYNYLFIH